MCETKISSDKFLKAIRDEYLRELARSMLFDGFRIIILKSYLKYEDGLNIFHFSRLGRYATIISDYAESKDLKNDFVYYKIITHYIKSKYFPEGNNVVAEHILVPNLSKIYFYLKLANRHYKKRGNKRIETIDVTKKNLLKNSFWVSHKYYPYRFYHNPHRDHENEGSNVDKKENYLINPRFDMSTDNYLDIEYDPKYNGFRRNLGVRNPVFINPFDFTD